MRASAIEPARHALRLLLGLVPGLLQARRRTSSESCKPRRSWSTAAERDRLSIVQSWGLILLGLAHYQRNELARRQGMLCQAPRLQIHGQCRRAA